MYNFIDVNEVSDGVVLPSEALMINGEYIENQITGYRTLTVQGREALSPDVVGYTTGVRDGSRVKSKRFPERIITVTYQLIAKSNEEFREAYNKLAAILNVKDAVLIFNDEQDKFFVGTPCVIDAVNPGTNSVIGKIEILCADPFKYSVVEYEAESNLVENGFLIDYKGTYKAFPTLEAEFLKENESDAALTGSGDCGYVAFFNDDEKIIQIGDPAEADSATYPKSQTLVAQQFDTETAWGAVAQSKWATNSDPNLSDDDRFRQQVGNVNIAVTDYHETYDPVISGTLLTKKSTAAKPNIEYKVTAKASGREEDRINVKVTIAAYVKGVAVTKYKNDYNANAGYAITLNREPLFSSSDAKTRLTTVTGTYYLWDTSFKNGRIRITNKRSNVGKSGQVTGWVTGKADWLVGTEYTAYTGLKKGYGLKAAIQLGSGEWKYVTLKEENADWAANSTYTKTLDVTVKNLSADTTEIEDIKFKVERTDKIEDQVGIIEETDCADFEINTYTAPVASEWYLTPESYGVSNAEYSGPSITRTIPADAAGDIGAANFTFSYKHKIGIGASSYSAQEVGEFWAMLFSADNRMVASICVYKEYQYQDVSDGNVAFFVNGVMRSEHGIDLSHKKATARTCTITKSGETITFNAFGFKRTYVDFGLKDVAVTRITFFFAQNDNKPTFYYNGIYWAKFVKNNCDTYEDIPNKFSANDVLTVDCKNGEILLNGTPTPSLGALGNDWEEFYLTPGLNQIGYAYSHWVEAEAAPKCRVRYREVFI